jgi:predicted ATPase/class 3 adenylate cyclase/GAF domain-containing protein/tRNA A-37 threonylcarbamoyl transferase component Bud32
VQTNWKDKITQNISGYNIKEVICESFPYVIYSATRLEDDALVVIKTPLQKFPKKEDIASIIREYQITTQINAEGIVKFHSLVHHGQGNAGIVMERFGISLNDYLKQFEDNILPIDDFLPLAIQLTKILGEVHANRVIHKDLNPTNVLIDPYSGKVKFIDFGSSTLLSQEHLNNVTISKKIEGSLPYISPEQTGRMNRGIDYRTDYYSLGVTFYQLLTGKFPFTANDPLEWVHFHISKKAPTAISLNENIPQILSDIIDKLLSKNAEDRYQSSFGLLADLEKCLENFNNNQRNISFELAESDFTTKFQIPQKVYGRNEERELLESLFQNTSHGAVELCLVSGYSGVGKTRLVNELNISIISKHGYLIQGKFEQFKQNSAYVALSNAFQDLIRQILGETKQQLDYWKTEILDALGDNAQLLVDILPDLELIIGKQPYVQELPPAESQNRFLNLLINFIGVFAREDHPLVIFLDDLQWSDIPTLNFLNRLVTSHDLNHLFLIGTYRDNEVDKTHPLSLSLREIRKRRHVEELILGPLNIEATNQLLKDALGCKSERCQELGEIVFEKTGGNPYFSIELLKNLNSRGVIYFNADDKYWDWDIERVKKVDYSDNVVDILVASQSQLNKPTREILKLAACIGANFDLRTLSTIREKTLEETGAELNEAIRSNMIIPLNDQYKHLGMDNSWEYIQTLNPVYKFQHDRVQQAAYSQITTTKRQFLHLSIGRLILQHSSEEELEERLVEVVGHLNEGRELVLNKKERFSCAQLNLRAGVKAKQSSAYEEALDYLKISEELLGDSPWKNNYEFTEQLNNEIQLCFYLTGDQINADERTNELLLRSKSDIHKALALSARTRQYSTTGRMLESIEAAYEGLSVLGFEFILEPTTKNINEEVALIQEQLNGRDISDLIKMPEITDQKVKIASQLIMEIFPAAFLSAGGKMFPYLVLKSVNIALEHGNSPESAFAYAAYGMILCGYFENPAKGFEYGKLAVNVIDKFEDIALKSRIIYLYSMFVHHWSNHWSTMTPWFHKGIKAGYQSGDLLYLAYSAQDCIIWDPKLDLETSSQEHRKLLTIVEETGYQDSLDSGTLFLQMQQNFQGLTESQYSLSDDSFNEENCLSGMQERNFMTGISNYHIYKTEIHLLYNDPEGAWEHVLKQDERESSVMALPQMVRFQIASFLIRSLALSKLNKSEKAEQMGKMEASLQKMTAWAKICPENFDHLRLLMEAELAGNSDNIQEALNLYSLAIESAHTNEFRRDEAMANEFAAKFLLSKELTKASEGYLHASHYIYYQWGAHRKVEDMESEYQSILNLKAYQNTSSSFSKTIKTSSTSSMTFNSDLLDMSSVFRASQTISGELILDKLLKATLNILMENAGAEKGLLVENRSGQILIQANKQISNEENSTEPQLQDIENSMLIPITLINTAIRTKKPIVISNASEPNAYSSDPYIRANSPLSVMCVPLPSQGQTASAVYLENNLTHSAFTDERVEIIKLLASQASISMENARIYEEQHILLKAQQRFVPTQFLKHLGHEDIAKVALGESVSMEMSVMFSDIRDFTHLVEKLSPQAVIELLNRYFSELGRPISESGGFIDSYAGDALLALFAIPAREAVLAGIRMTDRVREFNEKARANSEVELKMGIGLNTGPLVLGTMGASNRMQCSVLGDTVNLASRIEQLTKYYGAQLLIGEGTVNALKNPKEFSIRLVDKVAVKGKGQAVELYEVLDAEDKDRKKAKLSTKTMLKKAFKSYFSRDFESALKTLTNALKKDPEDEVLKLFARRSKRYIESPPPKDWKGFEKLDFK